MSIPFSAGPQHLIEPDLPWHILIDVKADSFELMRWYVEELCRQIVKADAQHKISIQSGSGGGGDSTQVQYSVSLSTPLKAQIEQAEKHLAALRAKLGPRQPE